MKRRFYRVDARAAAATFAIALPLLFAIAASARGKKRRNVRVRLHTVTTPVRSLKVSRKAFVEVATSFQKGSRLLQSAPIAKKDGRYLVKVTKIRSVRHHPVDPGIILRATVKTPDGDEVSAVFKPFQRRYRDGFKELAACRLAAHLGVRQPPCTERTMTKAQLERALDDVPAKYRRLLIWDGDKLRGFFRLWAERFKTRVGRLAPSRENLLGLAKQIRPKGSCANDRICRDMSDLLVFDYLIGNNDRQYNVGTIRPAPNKLLMFPIDWGDAFTGNEKSMARKVWYRKAFYALARYRRSLIAGIQALSRKKIARLTTNSQGKPLINAFQRDHMMKQRKEILERVRRLVKTYGDRIFFSSR
jgi:hypothetical protein